MTYEVSLNSLLSTTNNRSKLDECYVTLMKLTNYFDTVGSLEFDLSNILAVHKLDFGADPDTFSTHELHVGGVGVGGEEVPWKLVLRLYIPTLRSGLLDLWHYRLPAGPALSLISSLPPPDETPNRPSLGSPGCDWCGRCWEFLLFEEDMREMKPIADRFLVAGVQVRTE